MKLVSADFSKQDVDNIKEWVEIMAESDKSLTLKKYVRFCIVQMTNTLMDMRKKEIEKIKEAEAALKLKGDNNE